MAKFGYYRQGPSNAVLIQEFEGTRIKYNGLDFVTVQLDGSNNASNDVAVIHLKEGEWVAKVENISPQRGIA